MAEKQLYTHNPDNITLSVGAHIVTGFAEGSAVKAEMNADQVTLKVGVKGAGARSISQDKSGKITLMLWAGSPSNIYLSQLADKDRKDGSGAVPVHMEDLSNGTSAHTKAAWVVKKPETDKNKEHAQQTWVLETHNLDYVLGGETSI